EACARLADAGIPVGNQTVLLRGINDDAGTMKQLCEGLVRMRVRPYYLYQAQLIGGTAHLRTSIEKGLSIIKALQGRTSGYAIPKYVLDTPLGKVPLNGTYLRGRAGDHVVMESYSGQLWAEPNPIPEGETSDVVLPEIEMPETCERLEV
ncbi:MAG: arginine 2,3-aminomutase, partial [Rhodothermales bacterium]